MNMNAACFTTKYVIDNQSPIIYVIHDAEGAWQFFGSEGSIQTEDARIVALSEIINIDPTVKDILWMLEGIEGRRVQPGAEWITSVYSCK